MFDDYKFKYGKAYTDANVYIFEKENNNTSDNYLKVSEKTGEFILGKKSNYLYFCHDGFAHYIDRKSDEYKNMPNIRNVIENIGVKLIQCKGCNTIVLENQITSTKQDKCFYCDMYVCKKCKKLKPLIELDENKLCEKCRNMNGNL